MVGTLATSDVTGDVSQNQDNVGKHRGRAGLKRLPVAFVVAAGFGLAGGYALLDAPETLISEDNMLRYIQNCEGKPDMHGCVLGELFLNMPATLAVSAGSLGAAGGIIWRKRKQGRALKP